jgi:hypothetical protein
MKTFTCLIAAAVVVAGGLMVSAVQAQGSGPGTLSNNLFNQYYTQGGANLTNAALYPAPHPVPYKVGNTYYTYQPLMPHELMWQHSRNYYNYYAPPSAFYTDPCKGGGFGGLNKTTVVWGSTCTNHMGPLPGSITHFANLQGRLLNHKYCLGGQGCGNQGLLGRHGLHGHGLHGHGLLHHHQGDCNTAGQGQCGGVSGGCPSCTAAAQQAGQVQR